MQEYVRLKYEPASEPLHTPPPPPASATCGGGGGTGSLPLLKRHSHLPGQWLQCQANGSNVCRVLRPRPPVLLAPPARGAVYCRANMAHIRQSRPDSGLVFQAIDSGPLWEGYHESRRCSRDTYPESYITKYTRIRRYKSFKPFKVFPLRSEAAPQHEVDFSEPSLAFFQQVPPPHQPSGLDQIQTGI